MTAVQRVNAAVESALKLHVGPDESICVALSGGMDSMVLLDAVANIRNRVSAVHVNHGLQPDAEVWVDFCTAQCERRYVPLTVSRVMVPNSGKGLEAAARDARYAVFGSLPSRWILQAHHADDAAETLLLRLNRGTGLRGLCGIPRMRNLDATHSLLRPFLDLPRSVLHEYSQARNLGWVEDKSNEDTRLDRNYLRKSVIPLIEVRFPGWRKNWLRAGEHAGEAQGLLDELAMLDVGASPPSLSLESLRAMTSGRLRNALRYFLATRGVELPATDHLVDIERRLRICADDASLGIVVGASALMQYRGKVFCVAAYKTKEPDAFIRPCKPGESVSIPELRGTLHFDTVLGQGIQPELSRLAVCCRREAESMKLDAQRPTRTLKNLFQEQGIPPWERAWLPRIAAGESLVWVEGLGVGLEWQVGPDEPGWLPRWVPDAALAR